MRRRVIGAVTASAAVVAVLAASLMSSASPSSAAPKTVTKYPASASGSWFKGQAFDVCTAPSLSQMKAWKASPYGAIAVYAGGPNRGCAQPNLTASWVRSVNAQGWKLMPIYVGLQAPCALRTYRNVIDAEAAESQGKASATDAVTQLKALGMRPGSIAYIDMENYDADTEGCSETVLTYLSAYSKELHRRGYLSGVYGKAVSTIGDLSGAYTSTTYTRPDAIWLAEWDKTASLSGFPKVAATQWSVHQRVKQYDGDHYETYGGVKLRIDSNIIDAPVATVAGSFTTTGKVTQRDAPSRTATDTGTLAKGTAVKVVCQASGTKVSGTKIWDKLTNGSYISDSLVNTSSNTTFSSEVSRCQYPYQVTAAAGSISRTGAGAEFPQKKTLPLGALAWTLCQTTATEATGTSTVWNRIPSSRYVPDYEVASASQTTFSPNIPRC